MQQFPHVPDRLRNSRVRTTIPDEVPVSREAFNKLHVLEAKAFNLLRDCMHPAFEMYGDIVDEAETAVQLFRTSRASFITDITALEGAERSLEHAAERVRSLLARYHFMEKVMECRGDPRIGKTLKEKAVDHEWPYGEDPTDAQWIVASQDKNEGEIRGSPFAHTVRVVCRALQSDSERRGRDPPPRNPLTLILDRPQCYIVRWTLLIETKRPGRRTLTVRSGGILESNLKIDIKAPVFRRAYWRCRVYLVDRKDYNFPHLIPK